MKFISESAKNIKLHEKRDYFGIACLTYFPEAKYSDDVKTLSEHYRSNPHPRMINYDQEAKGLIDKLTPALSYQRNASSQEVRKRQLDLHEAALAADRRDLDKLANATLESTTILHKIADGGGRGDRHALPSLKSREENY